MPPKARKAQKKKKGYGKTGGKVGPPTQAQAQRKRGRKSGGKRNAMGALDGPALQYAKLLLDPCHTALTHPVYSGSDAGYLVKIVSYNQFPNPVGAGGTASAGVVQWVPGAISTTGAGWIYGEAVGGTSVSLAPAVANTSTGWTSVSNDPGNVFLKANASAYRTVAACMEIEYLGTEQNRGGLFHFGTVDGSYIDLTDTGATVAGIIAGVSRTMRMPDSKKLQINWLPTVADQQMRDPNGALDTTGIQKDPRGAVLIAWQGMTSTTPFMVKSTAVFEWQPKKAQGLVQSQTEANPSTNTLDDVLRYVGRAAAGAALLYGQNRLMGQMARLQM